MPPARWNLLEARRNMRHVQRAASLTAAGDAGLQDEGRLDLGSVSTLSTTSSAAAGDNSCVLLAGDASEFGEPKLTIFETILPLFRITPFSDDDMGDLPPEPRRTLRDDDSEVDDNGVGGAEWRRLNSTRRAPVPVDADDGSETEGGSALSD